MRQLGGTGRAPTALRIINTWLVMQRYWLSEVWMVGRALGVIAIVLSGVHAAAAQDAAKGEAVFRQCMACHRVGPDAKNGVGPIQNNVLGRQAGTVEGYSYSPLNKAAGEAGLVWTDELLFDYLADPNGFLKKYLTDKGKPELATGSTKMVFRLVGEQQRRDVIAYLKTFSDKK
jgi:cytochrome c